MKARWKILTGFFVLVAVAVLVPIGHHFQLKAEVARYVAELKAKGEPMELAQVIPPPVPPDKNSAPLFLKASGLFTTNDNVLSSNLPPAMRGMVPGKAMVGSLQPEVRSLDGTNSWQDVKTALEENHEAFSLLAQITNSSLFDFGLQYDCGFQMKLTHLSAEKKAVQKLSASAMYDLHLGDGRSAGKNIHTMLTLVGGTYDERTAISQLVRIAIAQIGCAATWEFLQSSNLTDESLAGLQADWSQLEFIQAAENTLPVEREGSETTFALWRSSSAELQRYFDLKKQLSESLESPDEEDPFWKRAKRQSKIFLWRYWWSYADELRYLKGCEVLVNTMRLIQTNGSFLSAFASQDAQLDQLGILQLNNSFDSLFSEETDFHAMLSESINTFVNMTRKVMRVEATKQITITAIALKRYQLKHGNYPQDLNLLVPELVAAIPLDPVDGHALRYRLNPDGTFLLYSAGENGKDDGGDPSLEKGATSSILGWQNPHVLDWVWPQPATEAETQYFYEHPPK